MVSASGCMVSSRGDAATHHFTIGAPPDCRPVVKWWRRINRALTMSERVEHGADINTTPGHCTATCRSSSTANSAPHSP